MDRRALLHVMLALLSAAAPLLVALAPITCAAQPGAVPAQFSPRTDRLIVKFRSAGDERESQPMLEALRERLSARIGEALVVHRQMGGGAHVVRLAAKKTLAELESIARRLREDPEVLYAVPDRIAFPQLTPTDPSYGAQWYLHAAASGGINMPGAWDLTTGSALITVAVVDTGVLPHADLAGRLLPGYDFVRADRSNDGDDRDGNAADPGDGVSGADATADCPAAASSWHGTRIAGVIAAGANNAGIAGIDWNARILPVRAIGKCGGHSSDVIDGIRWAAGLPVPGVPPNTTPARVINVSLVTINVGDETCDPAYQSAIDDATNAGAVVVVAAGNQALNAENFTPTGCSSVIAVGAVDKFGGLVSYSNTGPEITLSAPGGIRTATPDPAVQVLSTSNTGTLGPVSDQLQAAHGTSLAAAQVSGVASLMLSMNPALTPAQVSDLLRSTARPFPTGTGSYADCSPPICGAGILDAASAVAAAPAASSTVTPQVASDGYGAVALRADGTVWQWGEVYAPNYSITPTRLAGIEGVTQVRMRSGMILMLRSDKSVWSVGPNDSGQLGDGTLIDHLSPVRVKEPAGPGYLGNVKAIAVGGNFGLALKFDGTVWAWGDGATFGPTPQLIGGNVMEIAAGLGHLLLVQSDGTVLAAGLNSFGQLGDGTTTTRAAPVQVKGLGGTGLLTGVASVVAGENHSLALKTNGEVWAWGKNNYGQLGDGSTTQRLTPVQVSGLSNVVAVATSETHSLALKNDGTMWGWGRSPGNGLATQTLVPALISGLSGVAGIAAGSRDLLYTQFMTSYAVMRDGTLRAWGHNISGLLGNGDSGIVSRVDPAPVLASAGGSPFVLGTGDPVNFVPRIDAQLGVEVSSNMIVLLGIGSGVPISVNQGQYSKNGEPFTSTPGVVSNGDTVTVRQTSSMTLGASTTMTLTVGASSRTFKVSTVSVLDGTAETLVFAPKGGVGLSQWIESDTLTVNGINSPVTIGVTGGEYRIDGGAFISAPGTIANGQKVQLRRFSSSSYDSPTTATLTVGVQNAVFNVITQPAPGFSVTPQVASDGYSSTMLRADGTVWRAGFIFQGSSADGSTSLVSIARTPVKLAGMSGVKQVQMGSGMILMLRSDGTVWGVGENRTGQLGDGTTTGRATPAQVRGTGGAGFLTGVQAISAGYGFALALKLDGTLWAWGSNFNGQLGDATTTQRTTPVQVGSATNWAAVAAGYNHTIALRTDGTLWAWGGNSFGQLGNGTFTNSSTPVQVGSATNWAAAAAGYSHTIARRTDGALWAWGENFYGQLGDATTTQRTTPVQVGSAMDWAEVAAGGRHSLARKTDNTVWGWGQSPANGLAAQALVPTLIPGLGSVAGIAASGDFSSTASFAIMANGTLRAWGQDNYGQLGDGSGTQHSAPLEVVASDGIFWMLANELRPKLFRFASRFGVARGSLVVSNSIRVQGIGAASPISVAGTGTGVAYRVNGASFTSDPSTVSNGDEVVVRLTASASYGTPAFATLGIGPVRAAFYVFTERDPAAAPVVARVAAGENHTALLRPDGLVWAWGSNDSGQLGDGSMIPSSSPQRVGGLANVKQIASGRLHMLALTADNKVWAWGWNKWGQLGDGTSGTNRELPVPVLGPGSAATLENVRAIAAGGAHSLAVTMDGALYAWGIGGPLGIGSYSDKSRPEPVKDPGGTGFLSNVIAVAAGESHSVALTADGKVWAWGWNSFGQLGDGTYEPQLLPVAVTSLAGVAEIAAGTEHTLARKSDGSLWAWGKNSMGQLGNGSNNISATPVPVLAMTSGVTAIAAGNNHSVAVKAGQLYTWGANENGQLGDGTMQIRNQPYAVPNMTGITAVAAGGRHTVALGAANVLQIFGDNKAGQVGNQSGNYLPLSSEILSLLRGDLLISQPVAAQSPAVGVPSSGSSAAVNHDSFGDTISFGNVQVLLTYAIARRFTNPSDQAYLSVSLSIDSAVPGEFTIGSNGCTGSLAPGAACEYSVTHTAQNAGARSAEVVATPTVAAGTSRTTRLALASFATPPQPGQYTLTTVASGNGTVTSNPLGISCGADCTENYPAGTSVTLSAVAASGAAFNGWSGSGCSGTGTCTVAMDAAKSVTASFTQSLPGAPAIGTATAGNASAAVSFSAPASNGGSAITSYTVTSNPGNVTASGAASPITVSGLGNGTSYTFTVTATNSVGTGAASAPSNAVTPAAVSFLLTVTNGGGGTVTSNPAGIACGADCAEGYPSGTSVTLAAAHDAGNAFGGWSGCDSAAGASCTVMMGAAKTVSAAFAPAGPSLPVALQQNFNLIGNGFTGALSVANVFGSQDPGNQVPGVTDKVDAVWRWNASASPQKWQFYSPQLTAAQSAAYATSHNFEALTSVPAGEGYWISAYQAFTLNVPSGTGFNYDSVSFGPRPRFWNLLAIGSTMTVQQFNCSVGASATPPCPANFESLWAWKAAAPQKWYFYSPQLDGGVPFTNCQYAANNSFLCFDTTDKTLAPGDGFWVYRP